MLSTLASPASFAVVGQTINHLTTVGEKTRMQQISQMLKEEQMRNQIVLAGEQSAIDKEKFEKNSIPIGFGGEEIDLDGDRLVYFGDDRYNAFDLSQRTFKPLHYEEAINNSKIIAVVLTTITEASKSVFLSDDKRQRLNEAIKHYIDVLLQQNGGINFITSMIRSFGNDYTYEELEKIYQDYKDNKIKKTDGFLNKVGYFIGSRYKDKNRYIDIAEALDILKEELASSLEEIRINLTNIKDKCVKKIMSVNVFKEKRKSEFLTRVAKSKVLLQRLYVAYKNSSGNLDDALFKVACELYRKNELVKDKSFLSNEQNKSIRKIEKKNIAYTSDNEVEEQVKRYFSFDPNVTRFIKTDKRDITIDKCSKMIEIQDNFNGVYYLDFNQLSHDIGNDGGILYYQLLLEALQSKADDYTYTLSNPKYEKVMMYIEDTIMKMKTKSLKKDEYEYLPNMLFHWISSLTNQPILKTDLDKKVVTVTFMDGDDNGKVFDEIDGFCNVSFDVYDPKTRQIKMGTIVRKGEKIYYKEDPGLEEFTVISAEDLLKKLNVESLQGKDIESEYVGDCWQMRKMLYFVQRLRDKEQQAKVNDGENMKQTLSYVSDNTADEERKEYLQTRVKTEDNVEKNDFSIKHVSNFTPINTLKERSVILPDGNNNNDIMSQSGNGDGKQNFTGNANGNISYSKPSINLQNENLSATLNQ